MLSARSFIAVCVVLNLYGCTSRNLSTPPPASKPAVRVEPRSPHFPLAEARSRHTTNLTVRTSARVPVKLPPTHLFRVVHYRSPAGEFPAYLSVPKNIRNRHPAIVWITGGDFATIGDVWSEADPSNDQTASAYRKAGIVMMFPSMRGGNENAGVHEGFYGEVEDVIAASEYLANIPFVDPTRIYLGGHSTGATMALLVAEYTSRFRAVVAFGPVSSPLAYGEEYCPFNVSSHLEVALRSPILWLDTISVPTFVVDGTEGNLDSIEQMRASTQNSLVRFFTIEGHNHFDVLAPINTKLAKALLQDTGEQSNLQFSESDLASAFPDVTLQ